MFRNVRRKTREISTEAAKQLLKIERRGILAVNGEDGYPYAIPLNYYYNEERNKIYFHGARAGYKYDMIKASERSRVRKMPLHGKHARDDGDTESPRHEVLPTEDIADKEIAASGKAVQMYEIVIEHISGKEVQEK